MRAHEPEREEGEEGAVIERKDGDGADVGAVAVRACEGDIHAAVAVRHRGDDRKGREAEEAVHRIKKPAEEEADAEAGEVFRAGDGDALLEGASADAEVHLARGAEEEERDERERAAFEERLGEAADAQELVVARGGGRRAEPFQR